MQSSATLHTTAPCVRIPSNHELLPFLEAGGDADAPGPPSCIAFAIPDVKPTRMTTVRHPEVQIISAV
eukprot:7122439-Pyramimonas_sp.AAC.1